MGYDTQLDLDDVRSLVENELCSQSGLLPEAFPLTHRILYKQGIPCGVFYCLHGPRSVRLTAVLDLQTSRILYYDSKGQRTAAHDLAAEVSMQSA